jgi:peptidoglycan hydrolase CwlO-like protein
MKFGGPEKEQLEQIRQLQSMVNEEEELLARREKEIKYYEQRIEHLQEQICNGKGRGATQE